MPDGDTQDLARAWLEVNCAVCHRPEGIAPHRRDIKSHTSNENLRLLGEQPSQGQLGSPEVLLIKPGSPLGSGLFLRISRRGPRQMPPLATNFVDPLGQEVLQQWIQELHDKQ